MRLDSLDPMLAEHGAPPPQTMLGAAAILLAVWFNLPYAVLAATYDYPAILRGPAGIALDRFATGGATLVLAWHGFALAALALVPLAVGLAITRQRLGRDPALSIAAAVAGALAGLVQALGLWRWVFVVPELARRHASPRSTPATLAAAEHAFDLLNRFGGMAIGEQAGQLLTALFVALLARLQWQEQRSGAAVLGAATAILIAIGSNGGIAQVLEVSRSLFDLATTAGFLALTAWLVTTGIGLIRSP